MDPKIQQDFREMRRSMRSTSNKEAWAGGLLTLKETADREQLRDSRIRCSPRTSDNFSTTECTLNRSLKGKIEG